jgi:hypothetical protein
MKKNKITDNHVLTHEQLKSFTNNTDNGSHSKAFAHTFGLEITGGAYQKTNSSVSRFSLKCDPI